MIRLPFTNSKDAIKKQASKDRDAGKTFHPAPVEAFSMGRIIKKKRIHRKMRNKMAARSRRINRTRG